MRPLPKSCLISFLATLPFSVPYGLFAVYVEYRTDLYFELCIQRLLNGMRPISCAIDPADLATAVVLVLVMAAMISIPLFPVAFVIVYTIIQGRHERSLPVRKDAAASGGGAPAGKSDAKGLPGPSA